MLVCATHAVPVDEQTNSRMPAEMKQQRQFCSANFRVSTDDYERSGSDAILGKGIVKRMVGCCEAHCKQICQRKLRRKVKKES